MIVTIGRQVGSGGRLVGKQLSERLGVPFYDREILARAAKESGIRDEFFEQSDERNSILHRFASYFMSDHLVAADNCLSPQSLFKFQSDAIRKAAEEEGGAIFVGRCSDYILRDHKDRMDIFVTASMESRIKRTAQYYNLSDEDAKKRIEEMESQRADYYNFFTEKTWGAAASYHLCIDTTDISIEQAVEIIINYGQTCGKIK